MQIRFFPQIVARLGLALGILSLTLVTPHITKAQGPDPCTTPIRIMPLGDSITAGPSSGVDNPTRWVAYRRDLWNSLTAAGYNVNFVGSQINGQFYSGFDPDHEGHPGWTAPQLADNLYNNNANNWLNNTAPNVILLHIGTNDLITTNDPDPGYVADILDKIDQYEQDHGTSVIVVLARITNWVHYSSLVTQFNDNIEAMASDRIDNGDQIIIVDMEDGAGINYAEQPSGNMADEVHPYATGYTKMAAVWFQALSNFLPICGTFIPPTITSVPVTAAQVGQAYSYDVQATGSPSPVFTLSANPPGMTINSSSGLISWNPPDPGTFNVVVQASNGVNPPSSQSFTITVTEAPTIATTPVTTAQVGQAYSYNVDAYGSPSPTYALTTNPAGMTINTTTGLISWTPTTAGTFNVVVRASNGVNPAATQSFSITVTGAPVITTTPVTTAQVGQAYSYDVNATGSPSPTYTLTTQPAGMTINTTSGLISWTPTTTGTFNVVVRASNGVNPAATQSFSITVTVAPAITSSPVTTAQVGQAYSYDVNATGSPSPTYTLTTNPAGMSINTTSGLISWTPTTAGTFNVVVRASNGVNPAATQSFSITVNAAPAITSSPVTTAQVGQAYSYDVNATGSPSPTYTLTTQPAGMTINTTSGLISWTPTTTGTFNVVVQADNGINPPATQSFSITVNAAPAITSVPVTTAQVGQAYSYDVEATGSPSPTYTLTTQPAGISINTTSGLISWTPTTAGTFDVVVRASNGVNPAATQSFSITVTAAPAITSVPVTTAQVGQTYSYDVNATGSPSPTFSLTTNPAGMTINTTSGLISWTPTTTGTFDIVVQADNGINPPATQSFSITVNAAPAITSSPVTTAQVGQVYSYDVEATGSPSPTFSLTTNPAGMTIDTTSGLISWTPTTAGTFNVVVRASNGVNPAATQSFSIIVTAAPVITSSPVTTAQVGQVYSYDVQATGSPSPTYTLTTQPAGMTINTTSGLISWTPTTAGTFDVVVQADNGINPPATQSFSITVTAAPVITSSPVTTAQVGQAYSYDVEATGSPSPTYTLTTQPAGMTINTTSGLISWTPATAGTFNVVVRASNGVNPAATQSFSITVASPAGDSHKIYLPIILSPLASAPDLVIDSLIVQSSSITVVIRNQGIVPVVNGFWVDIYFNPTSTPSINHRWSDIASRGAVWGIAGSGLNRLTAGGTLTLTTNDPFYFPQISSTPPLPAGANVFAFVDSINFNTSFGAIKEGNEGNNLFGPVSSIAGAAATTPDPQSQPVSLDGLPGRE